MDNPNTTFGFVAVVLLLIIGILLIVVDLQDNTTYPNVYGMCNRKCPQLASISDVAGSGGGMAVNCACDTTEPTKQNWSETHPDAIMRVEDIPCNVSRTYGFGYMRFEPAVDQIAGISLACANGDAYASYRLSPSNFTVYWKKEIAQNITIEPVGGGGHTPWTEVSPKWKQTPTTWTNVTTEDNTTPFEAVDNNGTRTVKYNGSAPADWVLPPGVLEQLERNEKHD